MSKYIPGQEHVNLQTVLAAKGSGKKLSMVTCYDASFARIIDQTQVDMVLVGDSLGNVMMGYENTLQVTLEDMIHHTACVSRVMRRAFVASDMPFGSYQSGLDQAVDNAIRLVKEGGAQAVKLEGGEEICHKVQAIHEVGIPVIGHLGLTPQSIHKLGGYKVQARAEEQREKLLQDAKILEESGASCLVLELVPADLAKEVSESLAIPTIGIGAGASCDGQVLVLQDLLAFDDSFQPKFLKTYLNLGELVKNALNAYDGDVKSGEFPTKENSF